MNGRQGALPRGSQLKDIESCDLGDKRLDERARRVVKALAKHPDRSFPEALGDDSELEGLYRFFSNERVDFRDIAAAHFENTVARAQAVGEVFAIHDSTEFDFPVVDGYVREGLGKYSKERQGFLAHFSVVVSADLLQCPLGVIGFRPFQHLKYIHTKKSRKLWAAIDGLLAVESKRWEDAIDVTEDRLNMPGRVIHVMDRESDIYELTASLHGKNRRFVSRVAQEHCIECPEEPEIKLLSELVAAQPFVGTRVVTISRRGTNRPAKERKRHVPREGRSAVLSMRSTSATIRRPQSRTDLKHLPATVTVNVVEAVELEPPEGEEPVRWLLITSEPVLTVDDVMRVVDIYRARWLIEEFNKAVKTGCAYESRQLESAHGLLNFLAICLPIATNLLLMRYLSRQAPTLPAVAVVTPIQLALLVELRPKYKWPEFPTVVDVYLAIASLGGHLKRNGPPGWLTISRGYRSLLLAECGWQAAMRAAGLERKDVINP